MIDKLLNGYKRNEATIQMLKLKINQWEETLTKDASEIDSLYSQPKCENLGVQTSHNLNPIESMMIRVENQKEKIKTWIKDSQDKIKSLEHDNKIVDILLESLDEESSFILIQKHFEKKKWNIITHQFNSKFRNEYHEYITSSGVRKKYEGIKREISSIFEEIMK